MKETPYAIESSDHRCRACEQEIPPGGRYFSAILYEEEKFARRNYCVPCWPGASRRPLEDALAEPGSEATAWDLYAFWKTARPPANGSGRAKVRIDPELLLAFFRNLGTDDPEPAEGEAGSGDGSGGDGARDARRAPPSGPSASQRRELRFVLALLLIRKKALDFQSAVQRDGSEWLRLVERSDPERIYWVENPELNDAELDRVRDAVGGLLGIDL